MIISEFSLKGTFRIGEHLGLLFPSFYQYSNSPSKSSDPDLKDSNKLAIR